jgi:uncharacterized tellurite resistance protein B-like protein
MSLLSRLSRLFLRPSDDAPPSPEAAERLAVAALLVHVARIDGTVSPAERDRLAAILSARFGDAADLVEAGGELDHRMGDIEALIDMLGPGAGEAERRRLLALAVEIADSDGRLHEFEDGLLWRLARALRLDGGAVEAVRAGAARAP